MSDEHLDRQLAEMTGNPQLARAIKNSLRKLQDGAAGPELAEMAGEILNGRSDLRGLATTSAYAGALTDGVERFQQWQAETPADEREHIAAQTRTRFETKDDDPR